MICNVLYDDLGAICLVDYSDDTEQQTPAANIRAVFSRHFRVHRYAMTWCLAISLATGVVIWYPHHTRGSDAEQGALLIYPNEMSLSSLGRIACMLSRIGKGAGPRMTWDTCAITAYEALGDFCLIYNGFDTNACREMGTLSLIPSEFW